MAFLKVCYAIASCVGVVSGVMLQKQVEATLPLVTPTDGSNFVDWSLCNKAVHSNLGGLGPDSGDEELRIFDVFTSDGRSIDLVITNTSAYHSTRPETNGVQRCFGKLQMQKAKSAPDNSVSLEFNLYYSNTTDPVAFDHLYFSVLDIDKANTREEVTFYDFENAFLADNTALNQSGDKETGVTFANHVMPHVDRPEDPMNLTDPQSACAVTVDYLSVSSWKVKFTLQWDAPAGAPDFDDSGRYMFFAGTSGVVPTPVPTVPTEEPTATPTAAPSPLPTAAPTLVPTEEPTATPTAAPSPLPTAAPSSDPDVCIVSDDPHIKVFDGAQVSFSQDLLNRMNATAGIKWLVKSALVSIQGKMMPMMNQSERNMFMQSLAVGGSFLQGKRMVIGPLSGRVTLDGIEILSNESSTFTIPNLIYGKGHLRSSLVQDFSQPNPEVEFELPLGVKLTVTRLPSYVNAAIAMPMLDDGQEGLCGNHNGISGDDALELGSLWSSVSVPPANSLFLDE